MAINWFKFWAGLRAKEIFNALAMSPDTSMVAGPWQTTHGEGPYEAVRYNLDDDPVAAIYPVVEEDKVVGWGGVFGANLASSIDEVEASISEAKAHVDHELDGMDYIVVEPSGADSSDDEEDERILHELVEVATVKISEAQDPNEQCLCTHICAQHAAGRYCAYCECEALVGTEEFAPESGEEEDEDDEDDEYDYEDEDEEEDEEDECDEEGRRRVNRTGPGSRR